MVRLGSDAARAGAFEITIHPMQNQITVRSYRDADCNAVRCIAYQTGYMGDPADWYWRDPTSFADVFTSYYTDHEPQSVYVAESENYVVGYLLGCVDTVRAPRPTAVLARQTLRRLLFVRPGTAPLCWRSVWDAVSHRPLPAGELLDPRWPAHLHINLLREARGCGAGAKLMEAWFGRLRALQSPGCHLATFAENTSAIAFFTRMGFRPFGPPALVPGMRLKSGGRMHQLLMVREISQ